MRLELFYLLLSHVTVFKKEFFKVHLFFLNIQYVNAENRIREHEPKTSDLTTFVRPIFQALRNPFEILPPISLFQSL